LSDRNSTFGSLLGLQNTEREQNAIFSITKNMQTAATRDPGPWAVTKSRVPIEAKAKECCCTADDVKSVDFMSVTL